MHGLLGDRFLKRFFGDLARRRSINPADEAGPVPGKEEPETIEKTDEITEPLDRKDGLDRSSGATQLPDELEQKMKGDRS